MPRPHRLSHCPALLAALVVAACGGPLAPSDLAGGWGGDHAEASFDSAGGATLQYDCAHGTIVPPIALGANGAFTALGSHVREHGGPVRDGEPEDSHPARYDGSVKGDRFTFTVTLTDDGSVIGPFTVHRGEPARLFRCL